MRIALDYMHIILLTVPTSLYGATVGHLFTGGSNAPGFLLSKQPIITSRIEYSASNNHRHITPILEAEYDPAVMMHGHMIYNGVPALGAEFHVQLI